MENNTNPIFSEKDFDLKDQASQTTIIREAVFEEEIQEVAENNTITKNDSIIDAPKKSALAPEFTTDIAIETMNSLQRTIFTSLHIRKLKKKMFADGSYAKAIDVSYMEDSEIEASENKDELFKLKRKMIFFRQKIEKLEKEIPYSEDEERRLKTPTLELIKKSGLDLPPGLALLLVFGEITSSRVFDLIMD